MSKFKRWLESKLFWLKTGIHMEVANNGRSVEEIAIRYKEFYFGIMLDAETGEPTGNFGWSRDATMFQAPIREHYVAERPREKR